MYSVNLYAMCVHINKVLSTPFSGGSRISRRGGAVDLVAGGVDSRGSYVSKILYVKMKELGPLGGACTRRAPLDPPTCHCK